VPDPAAFLGGNVPVPVSNSVTPQSWRGYRPGMTTVIKAVSFDAADASALAAFWAAVFGSDVDEDSSADQAFVEAAGWGGPNIWFIRVPEAKAAKNRMHFDLRAPGAVADEIVRLEKLGATVVERHHHHTVMQERATSSASNPAQHACRTRNDGRTASGFLGSSGLRTSLLASRGRIAGQPGYPAGAVGDIPALRQVEDDKDIAKRVGHDGGAADRDIERAGEHPASGGHHHPGGLVRRGDQPVRRVLLPGRQDDLCLAARHAQAGLPDVVMTPQQLMAEAVPIEAQTAVEIRHWDGNSVDHLEERNDSHTADPAR
jgi:hypothetical protein